MKMKGSFRIQTASDIHRDGLGVELIADDRVVAEVFRCSADHTLVVTTFGHDLLLVAVAEIVSLTRERLGAFEDGTPLPILKKESWPREGTIFGLSQPHNSSMDVR